MFIYQFKRCKIEAVPTTVWLFLFCVVMLSILPFSQCVAQGKSSANEFRARELFYRPISNENFLLQERANNNNALCDFAISIDLECVVEKDPPCDNLVPIAFNFCIGEMLRQMQPRVISKAEELHFRKKFRHCAWESVRALVTNPLRIERHCSNQEDEEKKLLEDPLVDEFLLR